MRLGGYSEWGRASEDFILQRHVSQGGRVSYKRLRPLKSLETLQKGLVILKNTKQNLN